MKIVIAITTLCILSGCYGKEPAKTGMEGKLMPEFNIILMDSSKNLDTKNISSGKPTVLLYIGPYCPHSKAQIDNIIQDIDRLQNIQFYIFTSWPYQDMKKFYSEYKLEKYKNITAGIDKYYFFSNYFNTPGVPYMAIYNKEKKLNEIIIGVANSKRIIKATLK